VATTTPQEQRRWAAVREQVGSALPIYSYRDALARAHDELHAADDLLPASAERTGALRDHVATFRGLRDHAIAEALNDHDCPRDSPPSLGPSAWPRLSGSRAHRGLTRPRCHRRT
jgi:hypothetical protein